MNGEMLDLAKKSIDVAKKAGASDCRVAVERQRFVEISYRKRKAETLREASTKGLSIQLFVSGRFSSQSTNDLRPGPLGEFIANAVKGTELLEADPFRSLPDPKYYEGRAKKDLEILDPDYARVTPEKRHEMARRMEDAALSEGGDRLVSVTAEGYDSHGESLVLSSNGFEGRKETTVFWAGVDVTAKDEGDRRANGWNYLASRKRKDLPPWDEIGRVAAQRALDLVGAKKIKTATMPVIVENRNAARLLRNLVGPLSAGSIQQKRSFLGDKKGKKIASPHLSIVDDPLLVGGLGSRLFDGDGFAARPRTIIESGVVREFFVDWYYSRKLGWEPTTGGPSNLVIPPGKRSVKEIMKDLGRGILITGFLGGNSNSATGDFSTGVLGRLFENGIPVHAVAELNIAGNHLEFWNRLIETANDPWTFGSHRLPSLVFDNVVVSGT